MRILQFSDIHLSSPWPRVPPIKWLGKRAIGALNLIAGRGKRFTAAAEKLRELDAFRRTIEADAVLFTGDYTALGLDCEFAAARTALQPLIEAPAGYAGIPGNHDIYTLDAHRERAFARHFGDTLTTDLPGLSGSDGWPLVRLFGDGIAVVALDSARPNPWPWRSSGRLPRPQLDALVRILADDRIRQRFVFVLNHYPPLLADGSRDRLFHRLVNDRALLEALAGLRRGALLTGHVHHRYSIRLPRTEAMLFCSGSATMSGREGLWCFEIGEGQDRAIPGSWDGDRYVLEPEGAVLL